MTDPTPAPHPVELLLAIGLTLLLALLELADGLAHLLKSQPPAAPLPLLDSEARQNERQREKNRDLDGRTQPARVLDSRRVESGRRRRSQPARTLPPQQPTIPPGMEGGRSACACSASSTAGTLTNSGERRPGPTRR